MLAAWLLVLSVLAGQRPPPPTDWSFDPLVMVAWTPITQQCSTATRTILTMRCQSGGLRSPYTWPAEQNLTIRSTMRGSVVSGSRFFAGLAIWQAETVYAEGALTDAGISASITPYGPIVAPYTAGSWRTVEVRWLAGKHRAELWVDGQRLKRQTISLTGPLRIMLVCASVDPGMPDDGSLAQCEYGPVTVEQP